jgi:hypothetical protein
MSKLKLVHSHTASSIQLAGSPIGILASFLPFQNMSEINEVIIHKAIQQNKSTSIYAIYFALK